MRTEKVVSRVNRMFSSIVITLVLFLALLSVGNAGGGGGEETERMAKHYYDVGVVFWADHNLDEAIENFNKAIGLNPQVYYYKVGKRLWSAGRHDEAIVSFEEAVRFNPQVPDYYLELASKLLYLRPGHSQRPRELIEKALSLDPDHPRAISALAGIYVNKEEYGKSVSLFKRAIELDPDNPDNYIGLGWCYFMLHQFEDNIAAMEKALDLDTTDYQLAEAHWRIGVAYLNLGNRQEARRRYNILKDLKMGGSYAEGLLSQIEGKRPFAPPSRAEK